METLNLEDLKAMLAGLEQPPSMAEAFARVLESWSAEAAEIVRSEGMPVQIMAGSNLYTPLHEHLSAYCRVSQFPEYLRADPNTVFLSWFEPKMAQVIPVHQTVGGT